MVGFSVENVRFSKSGDRNHCTRLFISYVRTYAPFGIVSFGETVRFAQLRKVLHKSIGKTKYVSVC